MFFHLYPLSKPNHHFSINASHTLKPNLLNCFKHESYLKKPIFLSHPRSTTKLSSFKGFFSYAFEFSLFSLKLINQILNESDNEFRLYDYIFVSIKPSSSWKTQRFYDYI